MSSLIPCWTDAQGRLWLDTGHTNTAGLPIVELVNGEAKGTLAWVEAQFGPLEQLSGVER
jgi:hypothetical protein